MHVRDAGFPSNIVMSSVPPAPSSLGGTMGGKENIEGDESIDQTLLVLNVQSMQEISPACSLV